MRDNLCLLVCDNNKGEVDAIIESGGFDDVGVKTSGKGAIRIDNGQ